MAEDGEVAEVGVAADTSDVWQPFPQVRLPHGFLRRLGSEQHHAFAFVQHEPLDQHQTHEGLAEADAVAEEGAAVLARDLQQRPVGFLLIAVDLGKHLRLGFFPLGIGELVSAKVLLECLRVDVERRVKMRVARNGFDNRVGRFAGVVPVCLEPFLELIHLAGALDLYVQLDIRGQAGLREVARPHQRLRADHLEFRVRDARLGVELVAVVDATLDLLRSERLEDRRHAVQERVGVLVGFEAAVEHRHRARAHGFEECLAGAVGHLRTHQDAQLVERLPLSVESEERADLEVPGRDVERLRDTGPLFEIAQPGPAGGAVIDDEEVAAFGFRGHQDSSSGQGLAGDAQRESCEAGTPQADGPNECRAGHGDRRHRRQHSANLTPVRSRPETTAARTTTN